MVAGERSAAPHITIKTIYCQPFGNNPAGAAGCHTVVGRREQHFCLVMKENLIKSGQASWRLIESENVNICCEDLNRRLSLVRRVKQSNIC